MNLCKYKNLIGMPNEGIHSYRVLNLAIIDIIITIIFAILISYFFKISFVFTLISVFIFGIIIHRLFCVRTTIDKLLFPDESN
jgi:hypothetical protein